jgi:hypothetical protein
LFRGGVLLPDFRPLASLLLPFGCLPATNQPAAFRIAAVALIPAPWLKDPATFLAQTESLPAGRERCG